MQRRRLVVNADDFGMTDSVTAGTIDAHERGIVTSASLMVRGSAAEAAAAYTRAHPQLSVGLHLDLAEWLYRDEQWVVRYQVVDVTDADGVAAEIDRQIARFEELVGAPPTHLDSHQHVHRHEPVASLLAGAARRLGVPLRFQHPRITYRGDFYGQTGKGEPYPEALTVGALLAVVDDLSPGWTELGCHPGRADPQLDDVYRQERAVELEVLCDPQVRAGLEEREVELASFHEFGTGR